MSMQIILNPEKKSWTDLTKRPAKPMEELDKLVTDMFSDIQINGDAAIYNYSKLYDKVTIKNTRVSDDEILKSVNKVSAQLQDAIQIAKNNIETFHVAQKEKIEIVETMKGIKCWRESRPINRIGIYIPGGSAPLFSTVLMLGIPAGIAGCKEIILCTPPDPDGNVDPAILFTANLIGIRSIFKVGGIQAIAAMTFGSETIPKTDKIFGPGNQYVTAAKQYAQKFVAIDMPAGPSEVLIIADETCNPEFVAADLLSQAEHGADSQVILLSMHKEVIEKSMHALNNQIGALPRKDVAATAIENSKAILFQNLETCIDFSNQYAPEHLVLAIADPKEQLPGISNAGSVFIGNYSCESAGDYASGTNHTLPTNGHARSYSGVSVDSFIKKITFQEISKEGLQNIGPAVEIMADAEHLFAHKNAVTIRLKTL